jgi:acetolactate synthase-1/2/3 large subunit
MFAPKLSSERKPDGRLVTKPMEDMFPFLDRDEFKENMIIELANE